MAFAGYEMECQVEWAGRFELAGFLAGCASKFLQVNDAMINSSIIDGFSIETPTALVNINRLDLIALLPSAEVQTK